MWFPARGQARLCSYCGGSCYHAQVRHYQGLLSYLFFADVKYAFDLADWNLMLCACYWTPQATPLRTPKQKQNLVSVTMDNFEVSGRECQQLSPATRQRLEQQRQAMLDAWYWEERRRLEARLLEVATPQKKTPPNTVSEGVTGKTNCPA